MSNVVDFPSTEFVVRFKMPANNIIKVMKKSEDKIKIQMNEDSMVAIVEAINLYHAQDIVKRVLPDSIIIDDSIYNI